MAEFDPEVLFGQLAVQQGISTVEQVQECLRLLDELKGRRVQPLPRLAELLHEKGYLRLDTFEKTIRDEPRTPKTSTMSKPKPGEFAPQGEAFGKYIRTQKLGEGGMGEVWKAWDTELKRWVALKFLKSADEEEIARFRREAQTAARLDHPNITAIYEAGDTFIAMQYVEGRTLARMEDKSPKRIAEVIRQAALAVHYAHEHKIVHRDLKPANIMVQGDRVYVMDFGLAKPTNVASSLSVSGTVVGTPSYMSPEQARGAASLDHRTDVYSLGATLYDLLAGAAPFTGENVYTVLKRVIDEEPVPISRKIPLVDRDLETIAMKCLEKDPDRRYPTALALAEDLGRFLAGELILARPVSATEKMRRYLRRHRAIVIPTALAAILAVGFAGWLGFEHVRNQDRIRTELEYADRFEREAREASTRDGRRENLRRAKENFERILGLDPDHRLAHARLERVEQQILRIVQDEEAERIRLEEQAAKERELAHLLGRFGKLRDVLSRMDEVFYDDRLTLDEKRRRNEEGWKAFLPFEKDPTPMGRLILGWARRLAGYEEEGIRWMNEAASLDPALPYPLILGALVKPDRAAELLRAALTKEVWAAESEEDYLDLAKGYLALLEGQFDRAEKHLTEVLAAPETDMFNPYLWNLRAQAREGAKNWAGAIEDLERIRPNHAAVRYRIANGRRELREYTKALEDYDAAISIDPKHWAALAGKGAVLEAIGAMDQAIVAYEAALAIEPGCAEAKQGLERLK